MTILAARALFNGADVPLDFCTMIAFCSGIEIDTMKNVCVKAFKLSIGIQVETVNPYIL